MNPLTTIGNRGPVGSSPAQRSARVTPSRTRRTVRTFLARIALSAMALGGTGLGAMTHAENAQAAPRSTTWKFQVINGPWYLHPGNITDTPTISSPVSDLMPTGTTVAVQCVASGDAIAPDGTLAAAGGGDVVWEYGTDTATGNLGFASDQGLNTPTTPGQELNQLSALGIPECQSAAQALQPATPLQGSQVAPQQTSTFDRQTAATWAYLHGMDTPPASASCMWFVSNALWHGGLAKTSQWTDDGYLTDNLLKEAGASLGLVSALPGTIDAWNVRDFLSYMQSTYPASTMEPIDFSSANNDPKDAEVGDLVFYDWGQGEGISHVAIVTRVEPNGYLDVSDWSTYDNGSLASPVAQRGVTYSATHQEWLQVEHPNVQAWLFHIDTSIFSPPNP